MGSFSVPALECHPLVNLNVKHPVVALPVELPRPAAAAAAAATAAARAFNDRTDLVPLALPLRPGRAVRL
jgi:hypothetical protein